MRDEALSAQKMREALRVLVLGGTSEAVDLCRRLASLPGIAARVSLAGRTEAPSAQPLPQRQGGFGGVEGLHAHLVEHGIEALVDATHPFAARISHHAAEACRLAGVPLLALRRPDWTREPGDRWTEVADNAGAVAALGRPPASVFLTIGRQGVGDFAQAPQHHYLVRSIDPPEAITRLPRHRLILDRGPFDKDREAELMRHERIEILVTKRAGGPATYPKIAAARRLGLPVVMIAPPVPPDMRVFDDPQALIAELHALESGRR